MELFTGAAAVASGIQKALQEKKGFLVGRNGSIELEVLLLDSKLIPLFNRQLQILERNAGIFPATKESILSWISAMKTAIQRTDLLVAGWYKPLEKQEFVFLTLCEKQGPFLPLRALEPYYVPEEFQWTAQLKGRRIAIVSSFAETACKQAAIADRIWGDRVCILPEAIYLPVRTGYAPVLAKGRAEWPASIQSWSDAVAYVVQKVMDSEAEIVLIGCGGLGMVIGSELKARGKICIVMGGAIQVLFGIKGQRWKEHPVISNFWTDAWVWPSEDETPLGASAVERACYWAAPTLGSQ